MSRADLDSITKVVAICIFFVASGSSCQRSTHFPVTGNVTLDEDPLVDATLSFLPESETMTSAIVRTDSDGNYQADPGDGNLGLLPGRYKVRISTYDEGIPENEPPIPPTPERIPRRYRENSELFVEVAPKPNMFDFRLESRPAN